MDRCYETNMKEKPSDADDKLAEMIVYGEFDGDEQAKRGSLQDLATTIEAAIQAELHAWIPNADELLGHIDELHKKVEELEKGVEDRALAEVRRWCEANGDILARLESLESEVGDG